MSTVCIQVLMKSALKTGIKIFYNCKEFQLKNLIKLYHFLYDPIDARTVLVIEVNNIHGEVLPGYVKYLLDLNYQVDILLRNNVFKSNPFCRCKFNNVRYYTFCQLMSKWFLRASKIRQYKKVLISTVSYYDHFDAQINSLPPIFDYIKFSQDQKILVVEHDLRRIKSYQQQYQILDEQIIVLGDFMHRTMVNPHYFGAAATRKKNQITKFVVVGGIVPSRKNFQALIDVVHWLHKNNYAFHIDIVGAGSLTGVAPEIKHYFTVHGALNFPEMYLILDKADFFLPLLSPNNEEHNRYILTGVTGSAQLVYGFCLPCVIHSKFSAPYKFSELNSIIYNNQIEEGLTQAINMNARRYQVMCEQLNKLSLSIYQKSLENLKDLLER